MILRAIQRLMRTPLNVPLNFKFARMNFEVDLAGGRDFFGHRSVVIAEPGPSCRYGRRLGGPALAKRLRREQS
jgi:hypothetical protein